MAKTHLKVSGVDARNSGQTQFEFTHQTACGYVRDNVTRNMDHVNCFYCLRSKEMQNYLQIKKSFKDS
ncbi:hypothetical protein F0267_01430 [Vibrio coralliilyticus]|uniref:Uncharacterized protein n=1 Tax=Vibrio coralliilyticus TaxID=190893 RepID=A0AAN0SHC2_9VIBR|nr:hypothetical protein IX92_24995 [Vibrio coralliilyticus]NOH36885.1 hypothetical protein [Vibrio coralliilyticus]